VAILARLVLPATTKFHPFQAIGLRGIGAFQTARSIVGSYTADTIKVGNGRNNNSAMNRLIERHGCPVFIENPPAEGGGGRASVMASLNGLPITPRAGLSH
jgi:hypothetical protein